MKINWRDENEVVGLMLSGFWIVCLAGFTLCVLIGVFALAKYVWLWVPS